MTMSGIKRSGFTIIEVIMVILLVAILASVMAPVMFQVVECVSYDQKRNNLIENARLAFDRIGEEVWSVYPLDGIKNASQTRFRADSLDLAASTCTGGGVPDAREVDFLFDPVANPDILGLTLRLTCGGTVDIIPGVLSTFSNTFLLSYYGEDGQLMALPVTGTDLLKIRNIRFTGTFESRFHIGTRLEAPFSAMNEYRVRTYYSQEDYLP